jgi:hypothetical protein
MAIRDIGPLRGADEGLNHQIVDTFATVGGSDLSWTEKIWTSIARVDGTLQQGRNEVVPGVLPSPRRLVRPNRDLRRRGRVAVQLRIRQRRRRTAGYGAWAGHIHGASKGKLPVDGEHIRDCRDDEHLRSLGQFRDTPIRVREGKAVGFGILESIISGVWPELGLGAESDHQVSYG